MLPPIFWEELEQLWRWEVLERELKSLKLPRIFGPGGGSQFEGYPVSSSTLSEDFSRCAPAFSSATYSESSERRCITTLEMESSRRQVFNSSARAVVQIENPYEILQHTAT
jgi:hypothetical protein